MGRKDSCSFCGTPNVPMITGGNGVNICYDCIERCTLLIRDQKKYNKSQSTSDDVLSTELPTPQELFDYMNEYVVGQTDAKKVLAVSVYNHYKRIKYAQEHPDAELEMEKSNILIIGPTGTGKTLLARTLAKKLSVPFAIADATTLTEAGYVGEDVENILLKLIQAADDDIEKAEHGIIFVDEIDKIAKKSENVSITRDVSGEGVQQALLKIIEGTVASVPPQGGRKHPNQELLKINTKDILFICGGAFVGLDKLIEKRMATTAMGFGATVEKNKEYPLSELYKSMLPDDLIKFGLIPEFIGRLPVHVGLNNLTEEDLKRIIVEPKNSIIKQYTQSMEIDGVNLKFTDDAISAIAHTAYKQKTGARGIRSIVENVMLDIMFKAPSHKEIKGVLINEACITENKQPLITEDESLS